MSVAHFIWSGGIGGMERAVYLLIREQAKEHEVALFVADPEGLYAGRVRKLGCAVEPLGLRSGMDIGRVRGLIERASRYDVHHFHSAEPVAFVASLLCGRRKVRLFTERGGVYARVGLQKRARLAAAGVLIRRRFDGVSGNTQHAARTAETRYRLPHRSAHVTPNGIDFDLIMPVRAPAAVRATLALEPEAVVVGTSGVLKQWKRVDLLVRALAQLEERVVLVIVGDGPERTRLEALARALAVERRVVVTGLVGDIADYLGAMDVFVLPSDGLESFGNSVVEAMGAGVPGVVMADSPGVCEHLENGVSGFVAADFEGLVTILRRLTADPDLRRTVGTAGAQAVRERYSLEQMAAAYGALYARACERAAPRWAR